MNCSGKITNNTCPAEWDEWIKWPETCPGENATMECPKRPETLLAKAIKICHENGTWEWNIITNNTKSHYEYCIMPKFQEIARMCNGFSNNTCAQIAKVTRSLEMIGLSVSLISLTVGLYIFSQYRVLRNNRTKIHINLFISTLMQVLFRLIKYTDQFFSDSGLLQRVPFLDKTCIALLEYTRTAMFMWMFIEGLYLHNMIAVTVFQEYTYIKLYFYLGWSGAALMTLIWLVTMIVKVNTTWKIYYFFDYYWILEGPRCTIILVNFLFLLNIIRVLVLKLRESRTSEIEQVRKAVRAAIFLLPLLGTPNILFQIDYIYDEAWKFSLWSYVTYFLNSFQGFFVAVLYCFLNGEVQTAIKNSFYLRQSLKNYEYTPCKNFTLISIGTEHKPSPQSGKKSALIRCCKKIELSPEAEDLEVKDEWSRISREETNSSIVDSKNIELQT